MKALVTGANGFVGSHLVEYLAASGDDVTGLVRKRANLQWLQETSPTLLEGDVTDESLELPEVDVIYHVAGVTKAADKEQFERVNVGGATNMLRKASRFKNPPKVVVVSSIAAAGPSGPTAASEAEAVGPVSAYGRSKYAMEQQARTFAGKVPVTVVRPPIIYGPRDIDMYEVFKLANKGFAPTAGLRPKFYSILHVADAVRALKLAAQNGKALGADGSDGIYNISDTGPYAWDDFIHAAARALGTSVKLVRVPDQVMFMVGLLGELVGKVAGKPWIMNLDKAREAAAPGWVFSNDKANHELGFSPEQSLDEGFVLTCRWYQRHGWL